MRLSTQCATLLACLSFLGTATLEALPEPSSSRIVRDFNADWRFIRSDPAGAAAPGFADGDWSIVSTPHTYNDVDTFDDWSLSAHRGEQNQWSGRVWYRKTFTVPAAWRGQKVFIEFEAARQIAEVHLNGRLLGVSKSGFTPFGFDLTPHLLTDRPNTLAIMCDNRFVADPEPAPRPKEGGRSLATGSLHTNEQRLNAQIPDNLEDLRADQIPWNNPHWHPAHGGLYRNVRLHVTDPLHITLPLFSFLETVGPYIHAQDITADSAALHVELPVRNDRDASATVTARVQVIDAADRTVLTANDTRTVGTRGSAMIHLEGTIANPLPWEPEFPHLYRVVCSLVVDGREIDSMEIPFGIRQAQWNPHGLLRLNGRDLKLRGWGQKPTDEWPALGAAHPDWMHFHTLELMRQAGGNFVRWGHCAGGPASIVAGDRLGLIAIQPGVDGESDTRGAAWKLRTDAFRDTIVYFRNNPSILIWEGGNQKLSREHAVELRAIMDRYDPKGGRAYAHRRADQITAEFMDVGIGTEGGREIARLAVVEGEYNREESPRRVWDDLSPPNFGYPEAAGQTYQLTSEQFAINQITHWMKKMAPPEHSGGANWIFSDSTSGGRVAVEVARTSGEVDGMRLPKEAYHACAVIFGAAEPASEPRPRVHIVGHWTYPPGTRKPVHVIADAAHVELAVNGRTLGRAEPTDRFLFTFADVAWEPGTITATAYNSAGRPVDSQSKRTAGPAAALKLTVLAGPDGPRADGSDVALVDVEAVDAAGERCPTFQQRIDFALTGPGVWRGGYNSGKIGSINHPYLDLEAGINRVAIRTTRSTGTITLRATTSGLSGATVEIKTRPLAIDNGIAREMPAMPRGWDFAAVREPVRFGDMSALVTGPEFTEKRAGQFIRTFSYTGPSHPLVHVDTRAREGKNAYVDIDSPFSVLPDELAGADWIKAGNRDTLYSAVDLIELSVPKGSIVTIAHDDALPRPPWLGSQFRATGQTLTILDRPMSLFEHRAPSDESLTLGSNTEATDIRQANMYIVFVNELP